jgi:hypothetical protein
MGLSENSENWVPPIFPRVIIIVLITILIFGYPTFSDRPILSLPRSCGSTGQRKQQHGGDAKMGRCSYRRPIQPCLEIIFLYSIDSIDDEFSHSKTAKPLYFGWGVPMFTENCCSQINISPVATLRQCAVDFR